MRETQADNDNNRNCGIDNNDDAHYEDISDEINFNNNNDNDKNR